MSHIITGRNIDASNVESEYFLPYQEKWILDDSMLRLAEKSVRIGWTYADAFKNVRKRLHHKKRDYLFTTKDQGTAIEYVETCKQFAQIYNVAKSIISHGIDEYKVPRFNDDGRDTGFTDVVKVGYIKFDNGSRIMAFSSNANALRAYGGDVGMDEYAFHPDAEALWAAGSGRTTWGFDLGVWSSHNGDSTKFSEFAHEAAAGVGGWSYYKVTMPDAIDQGLVEKINQVSGQSKTREAFLADCKTRARTEDIYQQEYMCNPRGGNSSIVPWMSITRCQEDYRIERVHFEHEQIVKDFGEFKENEKDARRKRIKDYLAQAFSGTLANIVRYKLGFDVAASGEGDLACVYVDEEKGGVLTNRALFTCRTEDWDFIEAVVFYFMDSLSDVVGAGDETGLGRQICWRLMQKYPNRFFGVNFASKKSEMGTLLMTQLQGGEKKFSKHEPDLASDYYAIQKVYINRKWVFKNGKNQLNEASHCDIAWAGGLSSYAASQKIDGGYSGSLC